MRFHGFSAGVSALALMAATGAAAAQTAPGPEQTEQREAAIAAALETGVFQLGQINVIADDWGQAAGQAISQGTVSAEQVYTFNRNTLDDALPLIPGVHVDGFGGSRNEKVAYVRGFDLFQTPLSIDGVRVYLPYDNRLDLGRFVTPDLAEVQVQKGYVSVLNGPGGMGGAINLVTRKPTREYEAEARAGVEFGNRGDLATYTTSGSVGTRQEKFYLQLNGAVRDSDGFYMSRDYDPVQVGTGIVENGGLRDHSDTKDWRINVKAGFTPNETDEYTISYTRQEGRKNAPFAVNEPVRGITNQPPGTSWQRNWRWPEWNYDSLYFLSHTKIGDASYVKTRAFYNNFDNLLSAYDDGLFENRVTNRSFDSHYGDVNYGGSVEAGTELIPMNTLKAAVHFRRDNHKGRNLPSPGLAISVFDPTVEQQEDTWSFALENTFHATDRLDLVAGASVDYRDLDKATRLVGTTLTSFPLTTDTAFNWQAAAIYRLTDTGRLHASISDRTRFPTLWERFSTRFGTAIPNEDLGPERAIQYEIGWTDTVFSTLTLGATAFYSDVKDVIQGYFVVEDDPGTPVDESVAQNQNVGDGKYYGIELRADWAAMDRLAIGGHYTYLEREITAPSIENIRPVGTPRHSAFIYARWEALDGLFIVPSAELSSARYSSSRSENAFYRQGGFGLANLTVEYQFNEHTTLAAGVRNIFDRNYSVQEGFPEAGRNFFLNAKVTF